MIDDDAEYEMRRQIRTQADADVASFIASLDQDEGSGIPTPPTIKVTETSSQPVELDFIGFGTQGAGTTPSAPGSGGGPPGDILWACCPPDDNCSEMTSADCSDAGGMWFPGQTCDDDPCSGACCDGSSCVEVEEVDCAFDFKGIGVPCDPNPCMPPCLGCGFPAFDGSGRMFLTKTYTYTDEGGGGHESCCNTPEFCPSPGVNCDASWNCTSEITIDTSTCDELGSCEDPSGLTVYVCTDTPGADCDVSVVNCSTCDLCNDLGGCPSIFCTCDATTQTCTVPDVAGNRVCVIALSNECIV